MMYSKRIWVNMAIINLCLVASLGVLMRSKMVLSLPWIDYNRLADTHGHFAFSGWVSFALCVLLIYELPGELYKNKIYHYLLAAILFCSWATLLSSPFACGKFVTEAVSIAYILTTYLFSWKFIGDVRKSGTCKTVKLLSISSLVCLLLSSGGALMLAYLFSVRSLNAILYRDALFSYLHFQYNGFFTLAVFALIMNKVTKEASEQARKNMHRFATLLCLSILPSLFITFLWHQTSPVVHLISLGGAFLLLLSFTWFIITAFETVGEFKKTLPFLRLMIILALSAFLLKTFLQSLTVINSVNVLVFGNRPMIMGFLHLVFLGFVTLFLIVYFGQEGMLDCSQPFTRVAIGTFTAAIVINEILLGLQGLGAMFITSSPLFNWYLLGAGILLLTGSLLIGISRIRTKQR